MERLKQVLWNLRWHYTGFIAGSAILIGVAFLINHYAKKGEVKSYKLEPWKVTHCPIPFGLKDELGHKGTPKKLQAAVTAVWQVARELNKEVVPRLGYGRDLYVEAGKQPAGNAVITVYPSRPHQRTDSSQECWIPGLMGPSEPMAGLALGFFKYHVLRKNDRLIDSEIFMCHIKYKRMRGLLKKPRWLKLHPWKRYLKHEMMHPLMGANHPNWHPDVTHETAPWPDVSDGTIKILKRIYDPVCAPKKTKQPPKRE